MRFAADEWLWAVLFSLLLALILVAQGLRLNKDRARFGEEARIATLLTARTASRRTVKAALACLAVALAFVAAAQPQYGRGTRVLPATNLDVVVVLDYSKSMYARDVSPSRSARAKVEVDRLIRALAGARFAAVAFAGESISFPLTSDGSAIAQFFRGMEPNDLPVGGTAIARALENGRQLLARDPYSKNHEKVMILLTDGEDLEGDPVAVAQAAAADGIRVDVVQIGGQSPEPIPQVDENGVVRGMRRNSQGQIMTTSLSPVGEAQLSNVASSGGGRLIRASSGEVGLDELTQDLRRLMTEELSERVETVFADVFHYPLALCVLLLMVEVWVGTAPRRRIQVDPAKGKSRRRRPRRLEASASLLLLCCIGCQEADKLFERQSPTVNDAIAAIEANNPKKASELLVKYLETGPCEEGVIGAGNRARLLSDASFDLALAFSAMSSGPPKNEATDPAAALAQGKLPAGALNTPAPQDIAGSAPIGSDPALLSWIDCSLRLLAPVGTDKDNPAALRARSHYLAGNLELSRSEFEAAIVAYDEAILLAPGVKEATGDPIGLQIAWNRALALRLLHEKKEQEEKEKEDEEKSDEEKSDEEKSDEEKSDEEKSDEEKSDEEKSDEEKSDEEKSDEEKSDEEKKGDEPEEDKQESQEGDDSKDKGEEPPPAPEEKEGQQAPPAEAAQSPGEARDQRMLDLLEQAPTLQQHEAKKRQEQGVRVRATMEDK